MPDDPRQALDRASKPKSYKPKSYKPKNPVRFVTAASLFDGHDASINIVRRILQAGGVEVIHLGHDRSVDEIVKTAIEEDAHAIAVSSYQGGHVEYFRYMVDRLNALGAGHIKVFGGGGGTIVPEEIKELHATGVTRIYSPHDGHTLGLTGMIADMIEKADADLAAAAPKDLKALDTAHTGVLARAISALEARTLAEKLSDEIEKKAKSAKVPVLGITGTGGAGKSSLTDEIVQRFRLDHPAVKIALLAVDPTRRKTGGALLGDRIRMNAIDHPNVYMRSLATRGSGWEISEAVPGAIAASKAAGYDLVIVETSGIGQGDSAIVPFVDVTLYAMTPDYGAASQLEKIDMLDFADIVAINKFDKRGALDALRDVRKQFRRNHDLFEVPDEELPIHGTIASQFDDPGTNRLYWAVIRAIVDKTGAPLESSFDPSSAGIEKQYVIPPERVRYLAEIVAANRDYERFVDEQCSIARRMYQLSGAIELLRERIGTRRLDVEESEGLVRLVEHVEGEPTYLSDLVDHLEEFSAKLDPDCARALDGWPDTVRRYAADKYQFQVRDKVVEHALYTESLSGLRIPKICLPRHEDWGDLLRWMLRENAPGHFPYAAGVFPLKRLGEDPARMFAGEGGPERTNKRFHFVSAGQPASRLSTAFDSVTLYGEDPARRPDIYGKVGNSGVSICTVDDAKKLYSGFDLADPTTSVSMTINGPAPMLLAFFLNAAIDQQCEKHIRENGLVEEVEREIDALYAELGVPRPSYQGELPDGNDGLGLMLLGVSGDQVLPGDLYERIAADTLRAVRGTVQADILKEDQAQNTCIFSTEFALRMMGDIQQYFVDHEVRNFYSVSISGYHIAEAGANPITQLALTLANGFTYVEYYLSRGMSIDDFAPNLSFFFSNGLDAEYSVIGRVARRIWAKAMRHKYGANERSQKLKYHIQTSGRSLHAQEIAFNDIRTTLQALYALFDNCNSLHTNAYDEAITTPTEESVRRAMAIQHVINKELGLARNENPLQGSFVIEELTDLVEKAVLSEFASISERGGVLGAMERMYQRSKIQEESLYYESLKHSGALPIVGVNTFLDPDGSPTVLPREVIRATAEEKEYAIASREAFQARNAGRAPRALGHLQEVAISGGNTFEALLECAKVASLGQITGALYQVGGQYRRSM